MHRKSDHRVGATQAARLSLLSQSAGVGDRYPGLPVFLKPPVATATGSTAHDASRGNRTSVLKPGWGCVSARSDPEAHEARYLGNDPEGFAATFFQRTNNDGTVEKVLAIRGTEPSASPSGDLLKADIVQIGFLGLALGQAVSLVNVFEPNQADMKEAA